MKSVFSFIQKNLEALIVATAGIPIVYWEATTLNTLICAYYNAPPAIQKTEPNKPYFYHP